MPRRRPAGRMVRTMGRTAVVAGTATAVSGRVARRQQATAAAASAPPPPSAPVVPQQSAAPAMGVDSKVQALDQLAALKDKGILTEEEFAAEKAKVLAT